VKVFLCECGGNISGAVDLYRVSEALRKMGLRVWRYAFLCSPEGQAFFRDKVRGAGGVVVGACAPDLHGETFRALAREAGAGRVVLVGIREEAAWTEPVDPTDKALRLLKAGWAELREAPHEEFRRITLVRSLLVLGGGAAGITAALKASEHGLKVYLIEREPFLGGKALYVDRLYPRLECASCVLSPRLSAVARAEGVEILTQARVIGVSGFPGDFEVEVEVRPRYVRLDRCNGCGRCLSACPLDPPAVDWPVPHPVPRVPVINPFRCLRFQDQSCRRCERICPRQAMDFEEGWRRLALRVGGIIVATGFRPYPVEKVTHYGYRRLPGVLTLFDLEKAFSRGEKGWWEGREPPRRAVFVHCAGSRDRRHLPYCSEICCGLALKTSLRLKEVFPDLEIWHFYQDLRLKGSEGEALWHRARRQGIRFVRGRVADLSEVPWRPEEEGRLIVEAENTLTLQRLRLAVDLAVLVPGFVPELGAGELSALLGLCPGETGFFEAREPKTQPAGTVREGIWLAGACAGPRDLSETVASAEAAAMEAVSFLRRGEILLPRPRLEYNAIRCGRCFLCVEVCPFRALAPGSEGVRVVEEWCRGCGICVGACPSGALRLPGDGKSRVEAVLG